MSEIIRHDVNEEWAHSGVVEAGNFVYHSWPEYPHLLNYLVAFASGKWGMNGC